ncbi:MAG: hypothetical protein ACLQIB_05230 [Isosphaeraceae bacterium]
MGAAPAEYEATAGGPLRQTAEDGGPGQLLSVAGGGNSVGRSIELRKVEPAGKHMTLSSSWREIVEKDLAFGA